MKPSAIGWTVLVVLLVTIAVGVYPFVKFLDSHTTTKAERISRLEHRVDDLEARVTRLEKR